MHYCFSLPLPQHKGYVGSFDMRDPGTYTMQVMLGWVYGDSLPRKDRLPVLTGGHMGHTYRDTNLVRAMLDGAPIQITLFEPDALDAAMLPRFGSSRCVSGDAVGRWVNMKEAECRPPLCSGNRKETVNYMDWVSCCCCCCCYVWLVCANVSVCVRERLEVCNPICWWACYRMAVETGTGCGCPTRVTTISTRGPMCTSAL